MAFGLVVAVVVIVALVAAVRAAKVAGRTPKSQAPQRAGLGGMETRLDAFWAWWRSASPRLSAVVDAGQATTIAEEVSAQVRAIDSRLAWETGPGLKGARHHLALSSEGDIELRALTERWLSRAPPADAAWEYYAARQAYPPGRWGLVMHEEQEVKIDFGTTRVEVRTDTSREVVHVTLHHPALAPLTEEQRTRAAFLVLDSLLGEDGVERWVGGIKTSGEPPADGKPLEALTASVDALGRAATGERFAILQAQTDTGQAIVSTVNLAVKRVDHLLMDDHVSVTIRLMEPTREGLTTSEEAARLNALEDELLEALSKDAVYIGRETGQCRRVLHFHVASQGPADARIQAWARRHPERHIDVSTVHDPRWEVLRRW